MIGAHDHITEITGSHIVFHAFLQDVDEHGSAQLPKLYNSEERLIIFPFPFVPAVSSIPSAFHLPRER